MAITIIKNFTTNKFYPSANPINCTVDSNNAGKCNFRYICDVYVNGVKVFSDKLFPDPSTGYGFFQLSRVLQDYIRTYYPVPTAANISTAAYTTAPDSVFSVYCRFGEEYDSSLTCSGTVLQYPNLVTSNTFNVYEGAFDYESFPTYDYTDYVIANGSGTYVVGLTPSATQSVLFLTNSPREVDVTYNDSYYLDFLWNGNISNQWAIRIQSTDYTGYVSTFSILGTSVSNKKRWRLAVGPYDINKAFATPVINQQHVKYTIQLVVFSLTVDGAFIPLTEKFTFNVKSPKNFTTRMAFVGLLGGIEQFTFFHRNKGAFDVQKKTFERSLQSNYSNEWKYQVGDRGTTTYAISAKEKRNVSTFCSQEVSKWLYEMWLSPDVWVVKRPELIPIRIYKAGPGTFDKVLIWAEDTSTLSVGDKINVFPERVAWDYDFIGQFTIQSIDGNKVDVGMDNNSYSLGATTCGYLHKMQNFERLPVTISDNNIEVKQKLSRPIEYSLNYEMAYSKTTLRG